jgi:hypothetical protein
VGFVVDKVALGQVLSDYFGFSCQFSFHQLLHNHHLPSGAGTMGQLVADVPSGLSLTPPQVSKKIDIFACFLLNLRQETRNRQKSHIFLGIQTVTERRGQTLGTSLTYLNEKKMSVSACVSKHLICVLQVKECCRGLFNY